MKRFFTIILVFAVFAATAIGTRAESQEVKGDKRKDVTEFCKPAPIGDAIFTAAVIDSIKPMKKWSKWVGLYIAGNGPKRQCVITDKTSYKVGDTFTGKVWTLRRMKVKYNCMMDSPLSITLGDEELLFSQGSKTIYYLDY